MLWDRVSMADHDWTSLEVRGEDCKLRARFLSIFELILSDPHLPLLPHRHPAQRREAGWNLHTLLDLGSS